MKKARTLATHPRASIPRRTQELPFPNPSVSLSSRSSFHFVRLLRFGDELILVGRLRDWDWGWDWDWEEDKGKRLFRDHINSSILRRLLVLTWADQKGICWGWGWGRWWRGLKKITALIVETINLPKNRLRTLSLFMSVAWNQVKNQAKAVIWPKVSDHSMLSIYVIWRDKAKKSITVTVYISNRIEGSSPREDVLRSIVRCVLQEQGRRVSYIPPYWVLVYVNLCLFFLFMVTNLA